MVPVSKPRRTKSYTPPETSLQAYESQKDKAPADKRKILAYLMRKDLPKGATCDEVEAALSLSHQTASARIRGLFQDGSIQDSGLRRNTRTGRKATVWEAATA
jgi:DNA-binding Lrp family transcriptional regulator